MIHVHTTATRVVVSQSQVLPIVLGGRIPTSRGHIPTYGVYHGTCHGTSYGS